MYAYAAADPQSTRYSGASSINQANACASTIMTQTDC